MPCIQNSEDKIKANLSILNLCQRESGELWEEVRIVWKTKRGKTSQNFKKEKKRMIFRPCNDCQK